MKSKHIIYPAIILLAFVIPIARYYVSTPEVNACVQDYVDNLEASNNKWYIYEINWRRHIEAANSDNIESLKQYIIGKSDWCMMYSNNMFNDLNNTIYCAITYMIMKSPMNDGAKQPLALLKTY